MVRWNKVTNVKTSPQTQQHKLIPITKWHEFHPWPPIGGLRHLVFFAKDNGFDNVIRRVGRRVLIDETAFFHWADKQGAKK